MKNKIILVGLISFLLVPSLALASAGAVKGKIGVDQNPGGREMVMPGDNVASHDLEDYSCELNKEGEASEMEKRRALGDFVDSTIKACKPIREGSDPWWADGDNYLTAPSDQAPGGRARGILGDDLESPWHNQGRNNNGGIDEFYGWFETCTREHDKRSISVCIQETLRANGLPTGHRGHSK